MIILTVHHINACIRIDDIYRSRSTSFPTPRTKQNINILVLDMTWNGSEHDCPEVELKSTYTCKENRKIIPVLSRRKW